MTSVQRLTLELIRFDVNNISVEKTLLDNVDDKLLAQVFEFSTEHDVGYIVASALHKLNLLSGEMQAEFFNEQLASVYRCERIKHETNCITELFEREKIKFILLKGAVMKELYPQPEMRMSCDLDVLVHYEDIDRAEELLKTVLSFSYDTKGSHDIGLISPSGLKVELHFTLLERDYKQKELLDKVWEYSVPIKEDSSQHVLENEFFIFYHISHISKHFLTGGCGIRHFLDLWFIDNKMDFDVNKLRKLLEEAHLLKFSDVVFDVSRLWFSNDLSCTLPVGVEEYIFGGAFGTTENSVIHEKTRTNDSKIKIFLRNVFPSCKTLRILYPKFGRYTILLPFLCVARWCRIIFKDRLKKQAKRIRAIATVSDEKQEKLKELMKNIGLGD